MSVTGATSVLSAIDKQGGVLLCGHMAPIWAVVIVEFLFAYIIEIFVGSPASFSLRSCSSIWLKQLECITSKPLAYSTTSSVIV